MAKPLEGRRREAEALAWTRSRTAAPRVRHPRIEPLRHNIAGAKAAVKQCIQFMVSQEVSVQMRARGDENHAEAERAPQSSTRSEVSPSPYAANRAGQYISTWPLAAVSTLLPVGSNEFLDCTRPLLDRKTVRVVASGSGDSPPRFGGGACRRMH